VAEKKLRVGVIGANLQEAGERRRISPRWPRSTGSRRWRVATSHRASAEATAARFGMAHAFDDPRALVEHPDVDIVSVCVRVPAHRELVMLAVDAGKHVYCEWPLGRDTAEAEELHRAAETRGVVHMVGLQARQLADAGLCPRSDRGKAPSARCGAPRSLIQPTGSHGLSLR